MYLTVSDIIAGFHSVSKSLLWEADVVLHSELRMNMIIARNGTFGSCGIGQDESKGQLTKPYLSLLEHTRDTCWHSL